MSKSILNFSTVFIDTGVFIDLLKVDLAGVEQNVIDRITHTKQLFEAFAAMNRKILFQTSAVNVAELYSLGGDQESVMRSLLEVTNDNELEIIGFDDKAAQFHGVILPDLLGPDTVTDLKNRLNYSTGNHLANVKDRIRKDMLIVATAKMYAPDIVLTNDSGIKYFCDRVDQHVHLFQGNASDYHYTGGNTKIIDFAY